MIGVRLRVPAAHEDLATALLWERGTTGIQVEAEGSDVVLLAYFPDRPGLAAELDEAVAGLAPGGVEVVSAPEADWVQRVRDSFHPFDVGGFHVAASWDQSLSPRRRILVDPGRAFGTGAHETTRLCLSALEELAREGPLGRVIDLGTGTGILAVAASLLGARAVTGVDLDEDAIDAARRHARLNGVELRLVSGDGGRPFRPGSFELVLANLTLALLSDRREEIVALRAPGGGLVLSGFLVEDLPTLEADFGRAGPLRVRREGSWAALLVGP